MIARSRAWTAFACLVLLSPLVPAFAESPSAGMRTIGIHKGGIASTHFSPDGKLLVSGGGDKFVRVWDVASGKLLHKWKGPTSFTCAVRFSPDNRLVAAAGYESGAGNIIYLFDAQTGKELPGLPGHPTGGVRRLIFTSDGKQLLSGGFDGYVRLWDLATAKEVRSVKVEPGTVYSLDLSPDGKTIVTAGRDGLKLWEFATGKPLPRAEMNRHGCVAVAFAPDSKIVAAGDSSSVTLWEVMTGKKVQTFEGFKGEVSQILYSRDGRTLVTASYDRAVRLWESRTGRLIQESEHHSGWVWGIALSPDERTLATCSVDTRLVCMDLGQLARPGSRAQLPLSEMQLESHWKGLSSHDAGIAFRAVCALAADPGNSLPLLEKRLSGFRPTGPSSEDIARLVRDLDSDSYPVREHATEQLAAAGIRALPALQKVVVHPPSLEVQKRARRLLARLDPSELPPEELVVLRGVQTLEYMGTREARQVLEQLVNKGSERLSDEAVQALSRLER